ncbi:DUF58 domain-containing protein [Stutzerimonas nosocomialis]|uniref:DUF58 domain-containing protein n=1 Tax=Stutzerimonas nosocomialis TaxID=1056496 RepID=UPI0011099303|nr:DUF58 domain-containing protein [Stutzerimonas nosocomialis]TLX58401.1 DUF58 domain-containing protein [Stutzerimonas nosocomialis]
MNPTRRLILLTAALLLLAVLLGALPALGVALPGVLDSLWWGLLLATLAVAALDALRLRRLPTPEPTRSLAGNLPLGRSSEVRLAFQHRFAQPITLEVFDHAPSGMAVEGLPQRITLRPGERGELGYFLRPAARGHFSFQTCEIRLPSPLGLWRMRRLLALPAQTRVYPDFARLHGAQLTAVDNWLSQLGVRQQPRRGLGMEFHQLREFRDGDTLRQIDWKATARKRTPIAREYQDERDQQILFMLDGGRRMRSQDAERSHFDHALDACLLLSHVALRQGDAVGISAFATQQPRFVAPAKGAAHLSTLLNALYDLHSSTLASDFATAVDDVLARQRRRALVILLSNLRDDDDAHLLTAVRRLSRQHRVLVVSLREEVLDRLRHTPVEGYDQALAYCGTVDYLNARNALHERLTAHGVPVLDVRPAELGPEIVARYLAWKKAGTL